MSDPLNLVLLNGLAGALGGPEDAATVPAALSAIASAYSAGGPFAANLDALNAIAGEIMGEGQTFTSNMDAINALVGSLSGEEVDETYFPAAVLDWSNEIAEGLVYTDENNFPYKNENSAFITTI